MAPNLTVEGDLIEPRDLALALEPRRMVGRQALDQRPDTGPQLQREVRRRGAHQRAHVLERDRVVGLQQLRVLGVAHRRGQG